MAKLAAVLVLVLVAVPASATVFNDSTGDEFTGNGILDIVSLEVTDDGSNINFKYTVAGDPVATVWGKYMVMIDTVSGGDNVGNGWARPISWGQGGANPGADYWLGSWVDGSMGVENRSWTGSWGLQDASYTNGLISVSKTSSTVTISTALSRLGLGASQTFCFDAFTSGGGGADGAIDSLGDPGVHVTAWDQPSNAVPVCYTTTPEPAGLVLLGLGAIGLIRRRR